MSPQCEACCPTAEAPSLADDTAPLPLPAILPSLHFHPRETTLEQYLQCSPLSHALHRTAEGQHLSKLLVAQPLLDLGCGCGEFAQAAIDDPIDVGIDLCPNRLLAAARTSRYRNLLAADATHLPFGDETFRSVLSISVLEHLRDPSPVLAEVFRVLQPGGQFVFTAVLADVNEHLLLPRVLRSVGLAPLAHCYTRLLAWWFGHHSLLPAESWTRLLEEAGFEIVVSKKIVSPCLTRWWDLLLLEALVSVPLLRCGLPHLGWFPWWRAAMKRAFLPLIEREEREGSNLFVVAKKGCSSA